MASNVAARKHRRVFAWVFLVIQVLFVLWVVVGVHSASHATNCGTLSAQACQSATDVGTTIGVGLVIVLWVAVDLIVGITYAIFRMTHRNR